MLTNMGVIDRFARLLIGLFLLGWLYGYWQSEPQGLLSWPVFIAGWFLSLTGLFRFCPIFALLGAHSCATDMRPR